MKKLSLSISLPDNGGITFFGPLVPSAAAKMGTPDNMYRNQRMYISANQDPLEVGKTLMAMLADLQMSEAPIKPEFEVDLSL
ncbi:hypothetical protein [Flavobacterium sp.]|jgi:hypothetical protein|uniref:hypothetical protein n=1 Tax=Flavobacterium sp. TaxID=239 RepID=UPI0037BEDB59